jgi:ribosomal-protein-alanine acetyltransferase
VSLPWQLRPATPADVDAIMILETRLFDNDAWSTEMMARDVADPACFYLVAFSADAPDVVAAYAGLLAPQGAREGDIQTIGVTEGARGQGLGRLLMQALMTKALERGAREIFLEVRADNPTAQRLYQRLGFEELGIRKGYYQPDNVDAIVMRLDLTVTDSAPAVPRTEEASS